MMDGAAAFAKWLVRDDRAVYCAAPLFAPAQRAVAAILAGHVDRILKGTDQCRDSDGHVFLPFRDSRQQAISSSDRSRMIYRMDVAQLRRAGAVLALHDGLAKDSGVSMEIGFAAGLGVSVGVLATDFIWEGWADSVKGWQFDPVIHLLSTCSQRVPDWPPSRNGYLHDQLEHAMSALGVFAEHCLSTFKPSLRKIRSIRREGIYIDVMGGRYSWARTEQDLLADRCRQSGLRAVVASRYSHPDRGSGRASAARDIESARRSSIIVISGDSPEVDAGTAAIFGLGKAQGAFTILQYSSPVAYVGSGGQTMRVNLMLEQAADVVTASVEETLECVHQQRHAKQLL